jgi:hypothetical protein
MSGKDKKFEELNIERWGTFSVKDHTRPRAFVTEVLLYDRLLIPNPPDLTERHRWADKDWKPARLAMCFELLKDRAIKVPWDQQRQKTYKSRLAATRAAGHDARSLVEEQELPYELTRLILTDKESLPKLPEGVDDVRPVAAYPSLRAFKTDVEDRKKPAREGTLGIVLAHEFLVPDDDDSRSDQELLEEAVELAKSRDFGEKRASWYRWQEKVIRHGLSTDDAVNEMKDYYNDYRKAIKKKKRYRRKKFGFLCLKAALGTLPGILTANLALAAVGGAVISGLEFKSFDWKLEVSGEFTAAAMFYDARKHFGWK